MSDHFPKLPLGEWVASGVEYFTENFRSVTDLVSIAISAVNKVVDAAFIGLPGWLICVALVGAAIRFAGWKVAVFTLSGLLLIANLELWVPTMETLSLMTTAVLLSLAVGIPLGILAAEFRWADVAFSPILDFFQTLHSFVYLIPVVVVFGIGSIPAVLATMIYVIPLSVRLTSLGLKGVPIEVIEAGEAFGATRLQLLRKVKFPTAAAAVLAGVTQTIMIAFGFIVVAALIGAGGLGQEIVRGITTLDLSIGSEAGLALVILAIILDRIGRGMGEHVLMSRSKTRSNALAITTPKSLAAFYRKTLRQFVPTVNTKG